ncbi:MAG: DUF2341 domain-containing protein, partial [Thermoleophilia bacterium]
MHPSLKKTALGLSALVLFASFIFADTWDQTTTADFNTAGSSASGTQVINDSVQLEQASGGWQYPSTWWNILWQNSRSITVNNNSGVSLANQQVLVEPFRDSGDFVGNNIASTNLSGSWSFSEGTGTSTADASGNGINGTVVNGNWHTGRNGNAVSFNGTNTRVTTADNANLDFGTGDFTIEGWVNYNSNGGVMRLISAGSQADGANNMWIFGNWISGYRLNFAYWNGGSYTDLASNTITMSTGTWYHIACVRSGTTVYFYFNGVGVGSASIGAVSLTGGSSGAIIGARYSANASTIIEYMNGFIDDVRVHKRAMLADEISMRYGSGLAGSWHFSETAGTATGTTADMSGSANNGTLTNMTGPNGVVSGGRFGNAMSFDGTDDYVNVPYTSTLAPTGQVTFEAWASRSDWVGYASNTRILSKTEGGGYQIGVNEGTIGAGYVGILVYRNASYAAVKTPRSTLSPGWHHFVGTYDGRYTKFYVDGMLVDTNDAGASYLITYASSNSLIIGAEAGAGAVAAGSYFNGLIDEVRIYSRSLSSTEIAFRYNSGTPKVRHDLADVRFATSDSSQELSYWQETDTRFWVKVPTLSTGNNTINMYYGNPSAAPASSGTDTFVFFDDFEDGTLGKWTQTGAPGVGSAYAYAGRSGGRSWGDYQVNYIRKTGLTLNTGTIECNVKWVGGFEYAGALGTNARLIGISNAGANYNLYDGTYPPGTAITNKSGWHKYMIKIGPTNTSYHVDNALAMFITGAATNSNQVAVYTGNDGTTGDVYVDNVILRAFAAVEPTHTAPGTESQYDLSNPNGGSWGYNRTVVVANNSGGALSDYQMAVEPFRDTGDFRGDNLSAFGADPVGSWAFSEGTGASTADASSSANNGTLNGPPAWKPGRFGNGLSFDGAGDYVALAATNIPTGANPVMSIEAWVNNTGTTGVRGIVGIGQAATNGTHVSLCIAGSATFAGAGSNIWVSHWGGAYDWNTGYALTSGWHHIAYVYNGSQDIVYVDGRQVALQIVSFTMGAAPTVRIGSWDDKSGNNYYFIGMIDEVNIYSRVMTLEEAGMRYGSGLLGSWHLSEGGGLITVDHSGFNNSGAVTGATWTDGRFGKGLSFNGTTDYVNIPNSPSLDITTGDFTVEAWVNSTTVQNTNWQVIASKEDGIATRQGWNLLLCGTSGNTANPYFEIMSGGVNASANGQISVRDGQWHHIVGTKTSTQVKIYIDGALKSTGNHSLGTISKAIPVCIGRMSNNATNYMTGAIDEVRVYGRALSAGEVTARYNSGTPKLNLDLSDIRFTDSTGATEYTCWQETDTRFWVKALSIASGSSSIKMFYGNSSALSSSNGPGTFNFYDDFNYNDVSTWMSVTGTGFGGSAPNAVNGSVHNIDTGAGVSTGVKKPFTMGSAVWETSLKLGVALISGHYDRTGWALMWDGSGGFFPINSYWVYLSGQTDNQTIKLVRATATQTEVGVISVSWTPDTLEHKIKVTRNSANLFELFVDGVSKGTATDATWSSQPNIGFWGLGGGGGFTRDFYSNDIRVRKYSAIEPVTAVPGTEVAAYETSGTFISSVKDTGMNSSGIDQVDWTDSGSGTLDMQVRASNTSSAGWTGTVPAWETVDNGDTTVNAKGRYIQYKATFTGSGTSADPVLLDVTLTYTPAITPPGNSVSCDRVANTWYSTAVFTFSNDTGFGASITKYYYAWDKVATHSFDLSEGQWNVGDISLSSTSDGSWYMHYMPVSSTNTPGPDQTLGPFKFDGTAPPSATLMTPASDASVSDSTASFVWDAVTDTSGATYALQISKTSSFLYLETDIDGIAANSHTLSGSGTEFLAGNSIYYWKIVTTDGAGNSASSPYRKLTTTSDLPQIFDTTTGISYPDIQAAIDSPFTMAGDVIKIGDAIEHDENIVITKDVTIENAILAPTSGFAVTGQGPSGGEILRNCVITAGGISDLALGENLTIYNTSTVNPVVLEDSGLLNCAVKLGTTVTDCTFENCFIDATTAHFVNALVGDFNLSTGETDLIDGAKDLSMEFTVDKAGEARGANILDVPNFDSGAWDIGAYELKIDSGYLTPGAVTAEAPDKPTGVYPAASAEGLLTDVTVSWTYTGAAVAASFTLEWSPDAAFASGISVVTGIIAESYLIEGLDEDIEFHWRVKGVNEFGESAWSDAMSFVTNYAELTKQSPEVPVPTYPANGATGVSVDAVLMWEH